MAVKRTRKNIHAALRRQWHKDGTYEALAERGFELQRRRGKRFVAIPRCEICDAAEPDGGRLDIDHDHATDTPRGLLCRGCNMQLPRWPAWKLRAAADYLERVVDGKAAA